MHIFLDSVPEAFLCGNYVHKLVPDSEELVFFLGQFWEDCRDITTELPFYVLPLLKISIYIVIYIIKARVSQ